MNPQLNKHRIVLLGVGHTNAHILRMWRMKPIADAELVCISNFPVATYSGMLPGVLAGQYPTEQMEIDLVRLCAANNARLVLDEVTGLDPKNQELIFEKRPPLRFDALSIGIGSRPTLEGVTIHAPIESTPLLLIKPMQSFLSRLNRRLSEIRQRELARPIRVAVVGGGAGGVEIAFCLPKRIELQLPNQSIDLTIIHGGDQLLPGLLATTAAKANGILKQRNIQVMLDRRVTDIDPQGLVLDGSESLPFDLILWATSAVAPDLLGKLNLPTTDQGFLKTNAELVVEGTSNIFAVGDTGTITGVERPKSGVFAVRQGPILWQNLRSVIGRQPLTTFRPQSDFLKLLNTADGKSLGEYLGRTFYNRLAWRWKDHIDVQFMKKYQDYRPMEMPAPGANDSQSPMRCVGCGGKIGGSVLSRVLKKFELPQRDEVLVGLDEPDDAALLKFSSQNPIAVTTDFFASPINDHFLAGRIAALNSLSDAWAVGAAPVAALTIATVPFGGEKQQEEVMTELMAGALQEFHHSHTALVGGHTVEGPRITIGFTVVAEQNDDVCWKKSGLRSGDRLILTKPLGSGVLLSAHMNALCCAAWYERLMATMLQSNAPAAAVAKTHDVEAVTDVTGFGLAGHLFEMLDASGVSAKLELGKLPLLPGAEQLVKFGVASTLAPANRVVEPRIRSNHDKESQSRFELLFDPQTCGGLLIAVRETAVAALLDDLRVACPEAGVIGHVLPADETPELIVTGR